MWLLDVKTLDLHQFVGNSIPAYTILSHTWGSQEVTFSEMIKSKHRESAKRKDGYRKIVNCCAQAQRDGYEWAWIDSCCIDKRSSAELSEAINSMFQWYGRASYCYVYLSDVESGDMAIRMLSESRWFTRGWTLQELLAPQKIVFFAQDWVAIRTGDLVSHVDLANEVSRITDIPVDFLVGKKGLWQASIAQRIFWASRRKTTREEDRAYSLMGMFDISMPILYGEGLEGAFTRLQLEIMRKIPDQSILSWHYTNVTSYRLLAESPDCFENSGNVMPIRGGRSSILGVTAWSAFSMTNLGLCITVTVLQTIPNTLISFIPGENVKATLHCALYDKNEISQNICLNLLFIQRDMQGLPIFICHRLPEWSFSTVKGVPMQVILCGNDYVSNILGSAKKSSANPKGLVDQVLDIIALKLTLVPEDLVDNMALNSLDQTKCVAICHTIHKETSLEIDARTFIDYPTVKSFKDYITKKSLGLILQSCKNERETTNKNLQNSIRTIIAEELSVDVKQVIASENLTELGMDSLVEMVILSRLRDATSLQISHSLFSLNPSLKQLECALGVTNSEV